MTHSVAVLGEQNYGYSACVFVYFEIFFKITWLRSVTSRDLKWSLTDEKMDREVTQYSFEYTNYYIFVLFIDQGVFVRYIVVPGCVCLMKGVLSRTL